jgi:DNA-binding Xre family transcriptional regulator
MTHPLLQSILTRMQERKISKSALARSLGVTRSTINDILGKGANPELKTLQRICDFLELEIKVEDKM